MELRQCSPGFGLKVAKSDLAVSAIRLHSGQTTLISAEGMKHKEGKDTLKNNNSSDSTIILPLSHKERLRRTGFAALHVCREVLRIDTGLWP